VAGYRGHLIAWGMVGGLLLAAMGAYGISDEYIILGFMLGFGVTLLPDLDAKKSKIRQYVDKFLLAAMVLSTALAVISDIWFANITIAAAGVFILLYITKHRGLLHNPIAALVITAPLWKVHIAVYVMGVLAYATHVYTDSITTWVKKRK